MYSGFILKFYSRILQPQENAVITPQKVEPDIRRASINAINMFNRT